MERDLSKMYKDKKQESVNKLKDISAEYPQKPFTAQDVVMDVIMLFVTTALAFGWMLIMLLIFSFVTLSYVHIEIGTMLTHQRLICYNTVLAYHIHGVRGGYPCGVYCEEGA